MPKIEHGTRQCPFLSETCVQDKCELWRRIGVKVDPEWWVKNLEETKEFSKKSWWYKLWRESPRDKYPDYVDVYGCKLGDD